MPPKKNAMTLGMEAMLNDPRTSPFTQEGAKGFRAVMDASQMPMSEVFKHIGKGKKAPKQKEEDKSKARVEKLETETEADTAE